MDDRWSRFILAVNNDHQFQRMVAQRDAEHRHNAVLWERHVRRRGKWWAKIPGLLTLCSWLDAWRI